MSDTLIRFLSNLILTKFHRPEIRNSVGQNPANCIFVNSDMDTPVVSIVLEGGANTVLTVADSLHCNTPCVIIQTSGRAADVLALTYKMTARTKSK